MAQQRYYGWNRQAPDARDWRLTIPRRRLVALPPTVDLGPNMPALLDQGQLGSCGPNSADEIIQFDQRIEGLPITSASRLFIYWTTRYLMGTTGQDSGVDNRTMLKALAQYGFCPEVLWPYITARFTQQPPASCFQAALANRISNYAAIAQDLDQMRGCLASGHLFLFGFDVFPAMESAAVAQTGSVPDPRPGETPIGGHDVTIFGYDDATRRFKFRNHWRNGDGSPWGAGGNGTISYDYATGPHAGDFWAVNAVPGAPVPPPAPIPPPTPPIPPIPTPPPVSTHTVTGGVGAGWALTVNGGVYVDGRPAA